MGPKQCECGLQGFIVDSRQHDTYVYRRYECRGCDKRWSTAEVRLDADVTGSEVHAQLAKQYAGADREAIADKLIAIAQEILK